MGKIKYCVGQKIGPNNILFTKEISPYIQPNGRKRRKGQFECPYCGKIFEALLANVSSGKTLSCGCWQKKKTKEYNETQYNNLAGQKFGKLAVLEKTNKRSGSSIIWRCQCDCGKISYVSANSLISNHTTSCGCCLSKAERKIAQILKEKQINFIQQKTFKDCLNKDTGRLLRFDFYLPDYNICIEYDGEQHFKVIDYFGGQLSLQETQKRDKIKNQYCKNNFIKLVRIPYWDYNKITSSYISAILEGDFKYEY